jgi:hypothetical protein
MKSFINLYSNACNRILLLLLSGSLIFGTSCSPSRIDRRITSTMDELTIKRGSEEFSYLKLHINNGDLYVLSDWEIVEESNLVTGIGKHMNLNREILSEGEFNISLQQIVLAETNHIDAPTASIGSLATLTIITGIFTIVCIANPKACWGSCPTFYASNGNNYIVQSEGFSSSISPSLEEKDIDALYRIKPVSENFEIQLRNEAYETHVIRSANILALPKPKGGRVYSTPDGDFIQAKNLLEPNKVVAPEGDCSEKLCTFDGYERFSATDSTDLTAKEIIEFTFNGVPSGDAGLVIASRQTLLTTFLFYQTLAFMGTKAGEWLADLERNSSKFKALLENPRTTLGSIDVLIKNKNGEWEKVGEVGETGPIATDIKLIPLKSLISHKYYDSDESQYKIRLRMAKGLWRIDYVALAELVDKVHPIVIKPSSSFPQKNNSSNVVEQLTNSDSLLVTFPGDRYFLNYKLPSDFTEYELFMESQGYYLEWMRNEWLGEENSAKVYQMFLNPKQYYKDLAPQFKKVEAEMEETFWSSKYVYP